jgi:hypothetical protein
MGSQVGVIGYGNLGEQLQIASDATPGGASNGAAIIAPAVQNGTFQSNVVNRLGFNSMLVNFNVGAIAGAGNFTCKLQHSATGTGSWVDAATTVPTPTWGANATAAGAVGATANTDVLLQCDLKGLNQYVRLYCTLVSGTSVLFGATPILGASDYLPGSAN